jgi:hypothetical protein
MYSFPRLQSQFLLSSELCIVSCVVKQFSVSVLDSPFLFLAFHLDQSVRCRISTSIAHVRSSLNRYTPPTQEVAPLPFSGHATEFPQSTAEEKPSTPQPRSTHSPILSRLAISSLNHAHPAPGPRIYAETSAKHTHTSFLPSFHPSHPCTNIHPLLLVPCSINLPTRHHRTSNIQHPPQTIHSLTYMCFTYTDSFHPTPSRYSQRAQVRNLDIIRSTKGMMVLVWR